MSIIFSHPVNLTIVVIYYRWILEVQFFTFKSVSGRNFRLQWLSGAGVAGVASICLCGERPQTLSIFQNRWSCPSSTAGENERSGASSAGVDPGRWSKFGRRHEPQGCVRSGLVEGRPPRLDLAPGVVQRQEPVRVQASSDTLGDRRTNLCLAQHKRDLLARELRLLHAKSPAQISSDFSRSLSFPLEAFSGTGSPRRCAIERAPPASRPSFKRQASAQSTVRGPASASFASSSQTQLLQLARLWSGLVEICAKKGKLSMALIPSMDFPCQSGLPAFVGSGPPLTICYPLTSIRYTIEWIKGSKGLPDERSIPT